MTDEDIPSRHRDLLGSMLGASITRMTRYSWSPKDVVAVESNLPSKLVFSRTAGPLLITLDSGRAIAASSQPSLISVTLWLDKPPSISADPELHPVECNDQDYSEPDFAQMLGKHVTAVAILTREPKNAKWESRPREVGVSIAFDGAPDLILSHGLHDDSDDFSVLTRKDMSALLWPQLREIALR
ncbi:MAG TPA: hypothetical protein VHW23_38770 [Kofleriaceae bacterium]|nr:hypothetical protein [Kofleriaceae bacterium]